MRSFFSQIVTISVIAACALAGSIVVPVVAAQDAKQAEKDGGGKPPLLKSIEILAGREQTLLPEDPTVYKALVPVRIVPAEAIGGLRLQTIAVIRNGQLLDPGLVDCQADANIEVPRLLLRAELARMPAAGAYTVKVQAGPADPSLAAPPVLEFTLTRPAAELRLSAPLKLERVVLWPGYYWWRPIKAALEEHSGKSAIEPLAPNWLCELRGEGGAPAGRLRLELPKTIAPGMQGEITVEEQEAPSLGKSTGTLSVRSPQLATEVFEATVDVVSRVCGFWLLVAIGTGIGVGYWARIGLEGRRRNQQAGVFAAERLESIETAIAKAQDPVLKHDLETIRDTLQSERTKLTATPETIEAAARAAESSLADRLRNFAQQEASLRSAIATLRIDLGLPDRQPPSVVAILGSAQATLAEADGKVNDADLTAAAQILEPLREVILVKLQKFRAIWTADLEVALGRFGTWPEVPLLAAAVQQINSHITELDGKNDVKTFMLSSPDLQSDITASLLRAAVPAVLTQARDIHTHLTDGREPKLANELLDLQAAIDAAEASAGGGDL